MTGEAADRRSGRRGPGTAVALRARLALAGGDLDLEVVGGGTCRVGPEVVAVLLGEDRGRDHVITVEDRRVDGMSPAARVRAGLVAVTGDAPVAEEVTVRDHLGAVAPLDRVAGVLARAPLLSGRGGAPAGVLSGGERRVLAWLRARLLTPVVLLLDAAGTGADSELLAWMGREVEAHRRRGAAVLVRPGRPEEEAWLAEAAGGAGAGQAGSSDTGRPGRI